MKQLSTGTGLMALGVCVLAATVVATHRSGSEAFAQVTGGERRIVAQGVYDSGNAQWGYRVWSDSVTEVKFLGYPFDDNSTYGVTIKRLERYGYRSAWQPVDDGTMAFMPTDIDRSGQIDAGDIAQVLLNFNETVDQTTPPPIDCNINAPR